MCLILRRYLPFSGLQLQLGAFIIQNIRYYKIREIEDVVVQQFIKLLRFCKAYQSHHDYAQGRIRSKNTNFNATKPQCVENIKYPFRQKSKTKKRIHKLFYNAFFVCKMQFYPFLTFAFYCNVS